MSEKTMVLFTLLILMLFGLSVVLLRINQTKGDEYTVKVLAQQNYSSTVIPFRRGDILDRNGVTLATSIKVYNLILDPKLILEDSKFLNPTLEALNQCFGYDKDELKQLINDNKNRSYYVYQKQLSYEEIKDFLEITNNTDDNPYVKGVTFESEYQRKYPFSTLASQVIGFTASGNVGIGGLEQQYGDYLNGVDGREYGYVNSDNIMEKITKNAEDGDTVISTIDFNIQTIVEKYVAQWKEEYTPEKIAALVMDPNTGEILAMTGTDNFDLNDPTNWERYFTREEIEEVALDKDYVTELTNAAASEEEAAESIFEAKKLQALNSLWRNYCISDTYEPGSTFKPFTVATALEMGLIDENSTFLCDGGEQYVSYIRCHKNEGHGVITAADGLAFSCNDAMMQIATLEGKTLFANYQSRFGFGFKTGIDLPGESSCAGLLYDPATMIDQDLAISSFGQGFNVTMVQLAAAFCSVINGGYYYQPHVVSQIVKSNGSIVETADTQPVKQTVTKTTSDYIKTGLRSCVDYGTGKSAAVSGYLISGKTGTAQQLNVSTDRYLLSFIGFAPYETPEVVCYVLMDNPSNDSSVVTGSLYSAIMSEVLPYLNVKKDGPEITEDSTDTTQTTTEDTVVEETESTEETETTEEEETAESESETVSNIGMEERAGINIESTE
jgi:stage V sporulation protein D (sporulation-specific penicillin-binding protein)